MTPSQCRAARGLLNWTQYELAKPAGLSIVTVRNFENEKSGSQRASIAAIRAALEAGGVIFVEENGEGPGVRLRRRKPAKQTAEHFELMLTRFEDKFRHIRRDYEGLSLKRLPGKALLILDGRTIGTVEMKAAGPTLDPEIEDQFRESTDGWIDTPEMDAWVVQTWNNAKGISPRL